MRDVRKDLLGVAKNVMGLVADLYCSINVEYSLSPQSFFETLKMYMVFRSGVQLWGSVQSAKLLPQFNALLNVIYIVYSSTFKPPEGALNMDSSLLRYCVQVTCTCNSLKGAICMSTKVCAS